MNRSSLRTQVAAFCEDPNFTRFSTSEYNTALNRAQEQFAMESRCYFKDTSWSVVSGTSIYSLPSDFQYEDWVTYDGSELNPISRHRLQQLMIGSDWTDNSGVPTDFMIDPEEARKYITLYPNPDESGKTLGMRYFAVPAAMTSDTESPFGSSALLAQFHLGVAAFAAWLLLQGVEATAAIETKKRNMLALFNDHVEKAASTFKNTASEPLRLRPE